MGLDIGQVLSIGGPFGVISAIFVVLANAWLAARKDKREDKAAITQNDGGIVDNAQKVVAMVRSETERLVKRMDTVTEEAAQVHKRNRELELHINEQDDVIARLRRTTDFQLEQIERLQQQVVWLKASRRQSEDGDVTSA